MKESEFDKLVSYTLRVELLHGKVLLYSIDTENKHYLMNKLRVNSEGEEGNDLLHFLWFETSLNRMVLINTKVIARITFCFDYAEYIVNPKEYRDNFNVVEKDTLIEEKKTNEGEARLYFLEEQYLPQAIVYHSGKAPDDNYNDNPLLYSELSSGCLTSFDLELEGDLPFRQFLALIDNDGEESFIPLEHVVVMEFDKNLIYGNDEEDYKT
jgi:hypothetical protein